VEIGFLHTIKNGQHGKEAAAEVARCHQVGQKVDAGFVTGIRHER